MKIRITNRLIISEPTAAVQFYCRDHLILDNPEYYKKERMGKWLGDTPQHIWLYEKMGDELWLPFGCLQDIWRIHPIAADYIPEIGEIHPRKYESHIDLYPYQKTAVQAALRAKNGVLVMPCGSGKTQCGLEIISRIGGRALWLTHTQDLLNQSRSRAESVLSQGGYGSITAGKVNLGTHITFATVQTMSKLDLNDLRNQFDVVIVDECMPGKTLIDTPDGKIFLKNLRIGDIITSYNKATRKIENKRVTYVFKSEAHDIVKVNLQSGKSVVSTDNHPFFTKRGWVDAKDLRGDDYVMQILRQKNRREQINKRANKSLQQSWLWLLWKRVFQRVLQNGIKQDNEKDQHEISRSVCRKNENKQSYEKCQSAKSCIKQVKRDRTSPENQMRQWNGLDCSTANINACTCREYGSICGVSDTNENGKRFWLSDLLQDRHSNSRKNDCNRSGRKFSFCDRAAETRQKERAVFEWVRVDSVEVQKQTSDGTFGGLCEDGYVYNIEVEDNNNYFANDILVHNCQHCAGTPTKVTQFYKVVSRLSARYKIGLTATPKRADSLQAAMFAILGGKIHEVTREEVAHTTCPVKVLTVETGWCPDYNAVLMGDGTIDYNKVIDNMIHSEDRMASVFGEIMICAGQHKPTMVLANRVEYLQTLCDKITMSGNYKAICLSGKGQSKKAKAERKEALEKLNNGELDCIFASYQLAAEGLDCPNLQYVVFATPEQNETTVIQSVGRVGRKADGKDYGTVIDFVDDFGMYRGWYKKRLGYYRKIGAEI